MELKLEDLAYQREAIDAVIRLFEGQPPNTFDMACHEGVRRNALTIASQQIRENILAVNRGLYDRVVFDSSFERDFAGYADNDDEVDCFLKLPASTTTPSSRSIPSSRPVPRRCCMGSDYMFQLEHQELAILKSQFVTSSWGGQRKPPYAFTEQGVAILSSILKAPAPFRSTGQHE